MVGVWFTGVLVPTYEAFKPWVWFGGNNEKTLALLGYVGFD